MMLDAIVQIITFKVCLYPKQYFPDFITNARRLLMLSIAFFCFFWATIVTENKRSNVQVFYPKNHLWRHKMQLSVHKTNFYFNY